MRVPPAVVLALAALALAGCETTHEKSARLERAAHRKGVAANAQGLKITSPSRTITVHSALALHTSEGTAAAVTLTNTAGAEREVPLLISVAQSGAHAVSNSEPGLARSLTSVAYVPAHGSAVWVDDQIALTGTPGAVTAKVGEGKPAGGRPPAIVLGAHHLEKEPGGEVLVATLSNRSALPQHELAIYALARRGGHTVAAGRGVVNALDAGATAKVQIFLVGGSAQGAQLTLSAPPSTFG
jgi:hypothetical protein